MAFGGKVGRALAGAQTGGLSEVVGGGRFNENIPLGGLLNRTLFGPKAAEMSAEDQARFTDPNLAANKATLANRISGIDNRAQTQINMAPQDEFRGIQSGLAGTLSGRVAGTAPSVAEIQLRQGLENNIEGQMAQAASSRGVSAGLAQRLLANNIAEANRATNADAAVLRAGEQVAAENSLANLLGAARGQDIGLATSQAQLSVQEQAQKDQLVQNYINMGLSLDQAQFKAQQDLALAKMGLVSGNIDRQMKNDAALLNLGSSLGAAAITGGAA